MKIALSMLQEGPNDLRFSNEKDKWVTDLQAKLVKDGAPTEGPFAFDGTLTKLEPEFVIQGELQFTATTQCFRCGDPLKLPVRHPFTVALTELPAGKQLSDANRELEAAQESDLSVFVGHEIDLGEVLEEQCLLSLPYRQACKADCKGVCQQCGTNWNREKCQCADTPVASPFAVLKGWNSKS